MRIGWVGLGGIGTEMVLRALAAGHVVTAFARGEGQARVREAGAALSDDYRAIAAQNDIVAFCVFSDAQQREAVIDAGLLEAMRPGSVLVTHTTGSPGAVTEFAARAPAGVAVMDAAFSGGPAETAAGRLTIMAGGSADTLATVRPLLESYASNIHHVGELGHGQIVKLLNNLLFAANMQHAATILTLGEALGIEANRAAAIFQQCSGASMASGLFVHAASPDQMLDGAWPYLEKDVKAAFAAARDANIDLSGLAHVGQFYATPRASPG